jgi:hypothetical protein
MKISVWKARLKERKRLSDLRKKGIPIPYKPFPSYVRCPVCGKLARAQQIGLAGKHRLEIKKVIKPLGNKGFLWGAVPYTTELALKMLEILEIVKRQIKEFLGIKEDKQWQEKEVKARIWEGLEIPIQLVKPVNLSCVKTQKPVRLSSDLVANVRGVILRE